MAEAARRRIRQAFGAPTRSEYTGELNPYNSPRVTLFYDTLVRGDAAVIKTAFVGLTTAERERLSFNASALVFIDRHVDNVRTRACVIGMVTTRSVG
jgi:hypothetical protein